MGETGRLHLKMREEVGDVMRCRLAIDGGIDREDHLAHLAVSDAGNQRFEVDVLRPDAVERRQRAAKNVVTGTDSAGAFERPKIGDGLDDDKHMRIAARVAADRAGIERVDIAAFRADENFLAAAME